MYPGKLTKKGQENIKESFDKAHKGLSQSHKVALFEEGLKFQATTVPPDDAQFLETRKFQIEEIARIYRVPPHMLAQLEKATFSNIEQQEIEFVKHTLAPWVKRWEQVLNWKLLRLDERRRFFTSFNMNGLLRGDTATRTEAYKAGRNWGWLSANDVLDKEDENPIGEIGDTYLVPLNMLPAEQFVDGGVAPGAAGPRGLPMPAPLPQLADGGLRIGRDRLRVIFGPMFSDASGRIVTNEVAAIRRAITENLEKGNLKRFHEWISRFYKRHAEFYDRTMIPPLYSYANALTELEQGQPIPVDEGKETYAAVLDYIGEISKAQISLSLGELQHIIATHSDAATLPKAMSEVVDEWEAQKPEALIWHMKQFEKHFRSAGGNGNGQ